MGETSKEATDVVHRRKYPGGIYLRSLYLFYLSVHSPPLDRTCQIVLFLSLLNASIVNIRLNVFSVNGRLYIASAYYPYLSIFSLINVYLILHPYTLVRSVCQGLLTAPRNMAS